MFGGLTGGVSGPSLVDIIRANTQNPPPQQRQPTFQDVSHRPQSTRNLADLFRGLASAGIDPSRLGGLQGMFGQQQPRTIRTTDPGAGYGMSPSGPTAQMPTRQQPTFRSVSHRPSGPGDFPRPSPPPSARNPVTKPKPMSPFFEPFGGDPYTRMPFAPSP